MIKNNFSTILDLTAHRFPNNIAIIDENNLFTYEQLHSCVSSITRSFLDFGMQAGDMIVCLLPNGIEAVITHFAAAKSGAVLVPINTSYDLQTMKIILGDVQAKIFVVHVSMREIFLALEKDIAKQAVVIWVGEANSTEICFHDLINKYPRLDMPSKTNGNEMCSILYTAETTGTLRGVIRTHENNIWSAVNTAINRQYTPCDIELFVLPMHTIAFYNILAPNFIGGSAVLIHKGFQLDKIIESFDKYDITRMYLLPHMWDTLISHPDLSKHNVCGLRQLYVGSAPLSVGTTKRIIEAFPSAELHCLWGLTEGGQLNTVPKGNLNSLTSLGLNKPIFGNQIKVVDDQLYEVSPGHVGEIIIKSRAISPGYYKNNEETVKRFKDGWFHSAYLGRRVQDGYIYLIGRKSDTIICDDYKIYPQELEEALLLHPQVSEAAVFGYPDAPNMNQSVVAVVVKHKESDLKESDLNEFLEKYIASYKKPKFFFFVEKLPRTAIGKVIKPKVKDEITPLIG